MKRGVGVLVLAGLSGCSVGGVDFTKPTAALGLTGNYVLTVTAAAKCDEELPVTHYEWDVVGIQGTSFTDTVVMTLPGDDRRIHVVFCGSCQADPELVLAEMDTDGPPTGDAPVPGGFKLLADLSLEGRVVVGAGGRAEVPNGVADGTLAISRTTDEDSDSLGSCLSDVNSWSLRPR